MRGAPWTVVGALFLGLAVSACKPQASTWVTYNAGLAVGFVPGAESRTQPVAEALATLDADVVCLQEVWLPDQIDAVSKATSDNLPHRFFPDPQQLVFDAPACDPVEVEDMATCMDANCGDACNDEIVECLITSCFLQFLALAPECNRCVQAHVGTADAAEVLDTCSTGGIEYSYGGSFGTGILSKHPLGSTEEIVLDSTTSRRSLIRTTVEVPKQDPVEVWCTHLTAGLSLIPYPREEGSWEEEQRVQAEQLAALLADAPDPLVVLGDLNTGPDTNDADAEFIDHYQAIMAAGLSAPYVDQDGRCTFCPENAISSVDSDAVGRLIDHVLLRGLEGDTVVDRVFEEDMDIQSCDSDLPGALSDHYGVSVTISP